MARTLGVWLVVVLDLVIALYAAALIAVLFTGGIDLGWVSATEVAKPILVLWILVPIRVALPHRSWSWSPTERMWVGLKPAARSIRDRIPAAVRDAAFAFVVTRSAALAVGFLVNLIFSTARLRPFELPFTRSKFVETFAAWDSGWYFDIATRGYYYSSEGQSSVAFFPLYPLAMRVIAWPFGSSQQAVWGAGIAISCGAFLAGLVTLHRLSERLFHDREVARRTVLYMAVFPFSFFMTSVYASGLAFLSSVLAVSAAYRCRWWPAGMYGALATLARPDGLLIAVPLMLMAVQRSGPREAVKRLVALTPVPGAFVGYSLYVGSVAGDPLAWLTSQREWGFSLGHPPWAQLLSMLGSLERHGLYGYFFTSDLAPFRLFHGAAALFLVAMIPAVFTRLGAPLGAWVLISLVVPLSGNALEGIGRYGASLFPVFMVLGAVQAPRVHEGLLIVWSFFLALFVGLFATWHPIY